MVLYAVFLVSSTTGSKWPVATFATNDEATRWAANGNTQFHSNEYGRYIVESLN